MRAALRGVLLLACAPLLCAQQGDRSNDPQTPLPADLVVPPAIVRSPAEELATFRLPPGFEAQLVAAEPLVGDPIAAVFDADVDVFNAVDFGTVLKVKDESKGETQTGNSSFFTSAPGAAGSHRTEYTLTCARAKL